MKKFKLSKTVKYMLGKTVKVIIFFTCFIICFVYSRLYMKDLMAFIDMILPCAETILESNQALSENFIFGILFAYYFFLIVAALAFYKAVKELYIILRKIIEEKNKYKNIKMANKVREREIKKALWDIDKCATVLKQALEQEVHYFANMPSAQLETKEILGNATNRLQEAITHIDEARKIVEQ